MPFRVQTIVAIGRQTDKVDERANIHANRKGIYNRSGYNYWPCLPMHLAIVLFMFKLAEYASLIQKLT